MSLLLPPSSGSFPDFVRKVATAVNSLLRGNVFPVSDTPPPDPQPGQGWFDTNVSKAKVYDGSAWNALW